MAGSMPEEATASENSVAFRYQVAVSKGSRTIHSAQVAGHCLTTSSHVSEICSKAEFLAASLSEDEENLLGPEMFWQQIVEQ